uniref:Synaptotagmin-like 1 n=1 Tax=Seriola dumerili TaxID=41447 RepID=A0A3B4U144_SERDU
GSQQGSQEHSACTVVMCPSLSGMEGEQVDSSLDLSHLTDQEQSIILQVLQRDLELRRCDEGRVRNLQQSETDPARLRFLSGAWFSEESSKRHRNRTSGCDLVHATIRHRKTKSRGQFSFNAILLSLACGAAFLLLWGYPNDGSVVVAMVTDDDFEHHNGDTDSMSSSLTEADPASLKTSSSTSSLHSGYTLSGSMMSLFSSGDFGLVEVRGRIQFSLVYETQREELQVKVHRCEDIASARKNRSDPYVKTYLLPDKSSHSKKKTSVKKKTLSPVYDQTLRVHLNPDSISSRGTIMLSIKFIPDGFEGSGLPLTGELHIWLREAQCLLSNKGGAIDSFVRSYILPDASRQSGQKTRVVKRSISPTYNHTMVYDGFHTSDLREACAELSVWQREGLKTHILGGIRLSCGTGQSYGESVSWMDSTEEEVAVWTSMIENPNHWIDMTLPIRTNLNPRSE